MVAVPEEELLALAVVLRRAVRREPDPRAAERLSRLEERLRARLGTSVPKLAAARALGVSLPALDRWIARGLVPVVRTHETRLRPETRPLLELLEEVERLRGEGRTRGLLAAALRRLRRRSPGGGAWIVPADLAALPRPNVPAWELREAAASTTPLERLQSVAALSEALTTLRSAARSR